jgi:hypothetical protein
MLSMAEAQLAPAALAASCAGDREAVLRRLLRPTTPTGGSTARLKRENQNTAGSSRPPVPPARGVEPPRVVVLAVS